MEVFHLAVANVPLHFFFNFFNKMGIHVVLLPYETKCPAIFNRYKLKGYAMVDVASGCTFYADTYAFNPCSKRYNLNRCG